MALDIQLSIASITADRLTATLADNTVYGGANPTRNSLGCYVLIQKMNQDTTVAETVVATGSNDDPQIDVSWTFSLVSGDGWWRILFIAPEDYNAGTSYSLYDCVQSPSTSVVYRSKQAGNIGHALSDAAWWEVVTPLVALNEGTATESENLASTVYSVILTPNSEWAYANSISDAAGLCCSDDCQLEQLFVYIKLGALLDGAYVDSDRANYPAAVPKIARIESIVESLS